MAEIEDFARWNLANDIANELGINDIEALSGIGLINRRTEVLYEKIMAAFDEASPGGPRYDKDIWTLEGMRDHPFWKDQRELAKEVLAELEKIKVD
jgi:hypothetical protein